MTVVVWPRTKRSYKEWKRIHRGADEGRADRHWPTDGHKQRGLASWHEFRKGQTYRRL